jgi:uncharacterized SAM-binding protein YcdF (DUF218 family)
VKTANRTVKFLRVLTWFAPCALGVVALAFGATMFALDRFGQSNRARRSGAIVVLGAAVNAYGMPGPSLRARTLHAVKLFEQGYAPRLIFTGGLGKNPPSEAKAAAALAQRRGVPASAIYTETKSTSTRENIEYAAQICRELGVRDVIVVSDPYHLWRARRNFHGQNIRAYPSPSPNREDGSRFYMTAREALLVWRDVLFFRVS